MKFDCWRSTTSIAMERVGVGVTGRIAREPFAYPGALAAVTSKKTAMELARAEIRRDGGYYDAGHETGQPAGDTEAARLFWSLVADTGKAERVAEHMRRLVDDLRFANIPGYFATPPDVVDRVTDAARLPDVSCLILEP